MAPRSIGEAGYGVYAATAAAPCSTFECSRQSSRTTSTQDVLIVRLDRAGNGVAQAATRCPTLDDSRSSLSSLTTSTQDVLIVRLDQARGARRLRSVDVAGPERSRGARPERWVRCGSVSANPLGLSGQSHGGDR